MNDRVREVLDLILEKFESGEIPEAVAMASFPASGVPSAAWSLLNRMLMFLGGTGDARGYRQWKKANRHVVKGAHAIFILVPCFRKEIDDSGEEKEVLAFFRAAPVFRVEDTEGEPLPESNPELPEFPLLDRAREWGISVKVIPGDYLEMGCFMMQRREIVLATPEESVFFHELAHAAHEMVKGSLTPGQDPLQEIVAELSAQALCRLAGRDAKDTLGNSYRYIGHYAEKLKITPHAACLRVLAETEKVLKTILNGGKHEPGNEMPGTLETPGHHEPGRPEGPHPVLV